MSTVQNKLKIGDLCSVKNAWLPSRYKSKRCKIISFEKHGFVMFARVKWMSPDAGSIRDTIGQRFPIDELVKI